MNGTILLYKYSMETKEKLLKEYKKLTKESVK